MIDYLAPKQENGKWVYYPSWFDATQQLKTDYPDATGYWKYPRPGAIVSLSDCSGTSTVNTNNDMSDFSWDKVTFLNGHNVSNWAITSSISSVSVSRHGICIHHPKNGKWPAKKLGDIQVEANHWIIVKRNGKYYAATYEWIREGGQICKLVMNLSQMYTELGSDYINVSPLDRSWTPKGGDVVGFMVSGLARHNFNPNVRERSNIVWYRLPSVDGSISGQMLGSYGSGTSSKGTSKESFKTICTPEQLNNGFDSHTEKGCVPRCHAFANSNVNGVEMVTGTACDDKINYNILEVKNAFEDKCCRRSPKVSCPMGYRFVNGNCQPTCAQAAGLAGHTQKAWHNVSGNYVLHEKQTFANDANCRELDEYGANGYNDWQDFTFYDPYTFRRLRNDRNTVYEIIADRNDDYLCCVRSNPNTSKASIYDSNGWSQEDRSRLTGD